MKVKGFCLMFLLAVFAIVIMGCGGGGSNGDKMSSSMQGIANIHEDTLYPRLGTVSSSGETLVSVGRAISMSRVPAGQEWEDVGWSGLGFPPAVSGKRYGIVAFNDLNKDGKYQTNELLGFFKGYLFYSGSDWWIHTDGGADKKALDCRGGDIFIDADYKKVSTTVAEKEIALFEKIK